MINVFYGQITMYGAHRRGWLGFISFALQFSIPSASIS